MLRSQVLEQIIELEKKYLTKTDYVMPSGLYLGIEGNGNGNYFCSPVDGVTFGRTGVDGIHFAILTDFGVGKQLDECPIVVVTPMSNPWIKIVARNIKDFFTILIGREDEMILIDSFSNEDDYRKSRAEQIKAYSSQDLDEEELSRRAFVEAFQQLNYPQIPDSYLYIMKIEIERANAVAVSIPNNIGVMPFSSDGIIKSSITKREFHLKKFNTMMSMGEAERQIVFDKEPLETKLAMIRQCQMDIPEAKIAVWFVEQLNNLGFPVEAERLQQLITQQESTEVNLIDNTNWGAPYIQVIFRGGEDT
ncbi:hypothetical protein J2Z69_001346 [Paenibacillus shirakamiensis]|uniref:Uncharacterized protein n=1 Tax=Paenibacillus shirakamiensis TaxID=1265935 RepID=A0ABS4JF40_9BACL|nr:hypothetical protein [Paenibacillus shirakamiensis]MBP2000327.1 hypothetical protein [Paenibacillus shirakamiensis]